MRLCKKIKEVIRVFDFFATTNFFRHNQQQQYRTLTGGVFSILIIAMFCILFMNMAIKTFQKKLISFNTDIQYTDDQTPVYFGLQQNNFLITLNLVGINLNAGVRYFDFAMKEVTYFAENGTSIIQNVPLEPCTPSHFNITPAIFNRFNSLGAAGWICPPINYTFQIKGRYTSPINQILTVTISKCSNTTDSTIPCADQQTIANLFEQNGGRISSSFYFVNPLINPENQNYIDYFLNDLNFADFTPNLAVEEYGYITQYMITTDESLLPFEQNSNDYGVIVDNTFQVQNLQVKNGLYVSYTLLKSCLLRTYTRSYNKIDSLFSYIGGLFGAIMAAMIIMRSFTQSAFEVSIGETLYRYDEKEPLDGNGYNIIVHLASKIYTFLVSLGLDPGWVKLKRYHQCMEEVCKQLDIRFLMQRVVFLERAVQLFFDQQQFNGLHLQKKLTIKEAQSMRQRFYLKQRITIKLFNIENWKDFENAKTHYQLGHSIDNPHSAINNNDHGQKVKFKKREDQSDDDSDIPIPKRVDLRNFSCLRRDSEGQSCEDGEIQSCKAKINGLIKASMSGNGISQKIIRKIDNQLMTHIIVEPNRQNHTYQPHKQSRFRVNDQRNPSIHSKIIEQCHIDDYQESASPLKSNFQLNQSEFSRRHQRKQAIKIRKELK